MNNFKRTQTHYCASNIFLLGAPSACVEKFEADVHPASTMEEIVAQAVKHLPSTKKEERSMSRCSVVFPAFDAEWAHHYYVGKPVAYDIKIDPAHQMAAFVLSSDTNGYGVYEGIYGVRRENTRLYGELIAFNRCPPGADHGFSHRILSLEEGVVAYQTGFVLGEDRSTKEYTYKYNLKDGKGDKVVHDAVPRLPVRPSAP